MRFALHRLVLLSLPWLISSAAPVSAETRLGIPQSRALVVHLLGSEEYNAALAVTSVLVKRPGALPQDRLLHARALRGTGKPNLSWRLARQEFRASKSPKLRYAAALVTAQALSTKGHKTRAQMWLRRAAEIAPDDVRRAQAVRDFRFVRATNPWSVQARFGISPSSNVNRGPTDNTFIWNGLTFIDPTLVPLSGYEVSSGLSVERRITLPANNRLRFGLVFDDSRFVLSPSSRRRVPTARASDYDFSAAEARLAYDWSPPSGRSAQTASITFGRNWSGGDHLTDYLRAGIMTSRIVSDRDRLSLRLSVERQWRKDASVRSGDVVTIGGQWSRALQGGDRISLDLSMSDMTSDSASIAHQKARIGLNYALGTPVLGARTTLSLGFEGRWYDRPLYIATPREDEKLLVGGTLVFTEFDLFGFAPKVGLTATRTKSNVSRFETEALELHLGLQSVF